MPETKGSKLKDFLMQLTYEQVQLDFYSAE